ncbi:MAG TPA: glycoside hydrolase family 2 TIM barrel-domain containing protein [Acidimicrobiales bacterium]|nr:glycoside hydrolase family 2 TIM barrel-domain containing protein [Acidimicrobiales bacterium]
MNRRLQFDSLGRALLDGTWDFYPGEHALGELDRLVPEPIGVPGLWEAQGYLELDGAAWYRRTFQIDDVDRHWTLRFGAVMDVADVYLNGQHLGGHELPFTPFEFDVKPALRRGENTLAVRVFDPPLGDPEHLRLPHGKQGWMNHVFPSRPSLYLTYGGIWQSVQLRRHGAVVIRDLFVNGDPNDLTLTVELENRSDEAITAAVGLRVLGSVEGFAVALEPGANTTRQVEFGATDAACWTPDAPVLHESLADVSVDGQPSDLRAVRFGLRTVRVEGSRIIVNGEPYRMRSALVQGFSAERLYAEDDRAAIEREVLLAKEMGFNTLRLHIKAFDPVYLEVCDELGMFVHCDLPVAEPIAHEEMGGDTVLVRRCVQAITEQVRRDRNHPSIILWSAMNELCDGRREARDWPEYEHFARTLVAAVQTSDTTRPVIENDWIEPDPDRVFVSPILTAHWYGQLHADYFDKIEAACNRWSGLGRPFFVSEFGDWGLPQMPALDEPAFWDTRTIYETALMANLWPDTIGRFVQETQRYQGLADRLQIEVWRRHDDIGGYCLTELTDVPHELNGLLDIHRQPKAIAVQEVARANQTVLPMLELRTLVAVAGERIEAVVRVANDGAPLDDVEIELHFGDNWLPLDTPGQVASIPAHCVSHIGTTSVTAPAAAGNHDLVIRLRSRGEPVAENRYPIHVVERCAAGVGVRIIGDEATAAAVAAAGAFSDDSASVVVVGEGALDADASAAVGDVLKKGGVALVLAQAPEAAPCYPLPVELTTVVTAWGSTVFHFTTDHGALQSLPRRNLLVAEDSTVQATSMVTSIGGSPFPDTPVVLAFKPVPSAMSGTIVGAADVGEGRLVFCQYRLTEPARQGDAAARALLCDLLQWSAQPRSVLHKREYAKPDGRRVTAYRWKSAVAR